jgi:chlorophyllase
VRTDLMGLAGHSRGARVIWWTLKETGRRVQAVAGVDPVDGTGGPLGNEPRVVASAVDLGAPVLVIGAGLGSQSSGFLSPACAPEADNYSKFFAASPSPAGLAVAPEYGHMDMLDDNPTGCGFACTACVDGPSRAPFRQLTAGMLTAFFRGALSGAQNSFDTLSDADAAPVTVTLEQR